MSYVFTYQTPLINKLIKTMSESYEYYFIIFSFTYLKSNIKYIELDLYY